MPPPLRRPSRRAGVVRGVGELAGGVDLFEGGLELGAGGGEVLQEFGLAGELDDEGLVLRGGEHLVEEGAAGGALFVDDVALGEAGVDEQAEGQGKICVLVEVADGLGFAVDLEDEVVLGEVLDERAFFVADDYREVDEAGVDGEGGGGRGRGLFRAWRRGSVRGRRRGEEEGGQEKGPERARDDHVEFRRCSMGGVSVLGDVDVFASSCERFDSERNCRCGDRDLFAGSVGARTRMLTAR